MGSACPFCLQLHFHFKQLIVAAVPRGPVEKTFKAFLLLYSPMLMAPAVATLCQLESARWIECFFAFLTKSGSPPLPTCPHFELKLVKNIARSQLETSTSGAQH